MRPPFCRLELEFPDDDHLHMFVRALHDSGRIQPDARVERLTRTCPASLRSTLVSLGNGHLARYYYMQVKEYVLVSGGASPADASTSATIAPGPVARHRRR